MEKAKINTTQEVLFNLFAGFAAGCTGWLIGGLFDSVWASYILFFLASYLGYNVKGVIVGFRTKFVPVMQAFSTAVQKVNPHPILGLVIGVFCGSWVFAIMNGFYRSQTGHLLMKIWRCCEANYIWMKTGVDPLGVERFLPAADRASTFFYGAFLAVCVLAVVWFTSGWILEGAKRAGKWIFVEVILHPVRAFASAYKGLAGYFPAPWLWALGMASIFYVAYPYWLPEVESGRSALFFVVTVAILVLFSLLYFLFAELIADAGGRIKNALKLALSRLTLKNIALAIWLVVAFPTIGLLIALGKALALFLIGIHSARRLACGISGLVAGGIYLNYVPFTVTSVPLSVAAIGCGLACAGFCALTALALDGEKVGNALRSFVRLPIGQMLTLSLAKR